MLKVIIYILLMNIYMIYFITLMKTMLILGIMLASYRYFPALKILLDFSCIFYITNNFLILTTEKNCHKCCHNFDQWEEDIVCYSEFAFFPWVSLQPEKTKTLLSSVIERKHFLGSKRSWKKRLMIVKHKIVFWNYASCVFYLQEFKNSIIIFYTFYCSVVDI